MDHKKKYVSKLLAAVYIVTYVWGLLGVLTCHVFQLYKGPDIVLFVNMPFSHVCYLGNAFDGYGFHSKISLRSFLGLRMHVSRCIRLEFILKYFLKQWNWEKYET